MSVFTLSKTVTGPRRDAGDESHYYTLRCDIPRHAKKQAQRTELRYEHDGAQHLGPASAPLKLAKILSVLEESLCPSLANMADPSERENCAPQLQATCNLVERVKQLLPRKFIRPYRGQHQHVVCDADGFAGISLTSMRILDSGLLRHIMRDALHVVSSADMRDLQSKTANDLIPLHRPRVRHRSTKGMEDDAAAAFGTSSWVLIDKEATAASEPPEGREHSERSAASGGAMGGSMVVLSRSSSASQRESNTVSPEVNACDSQQPTEVTGAMASEELHKHEQKGPGSAGGSDAPQDPPPAWWRRLIDLIFEKIRYGVALLPPLQRLLPVVIPATAVVTLSVGVALYHSRCCSPKGLNGVSCGRASTDTVMKSGMREWLV